MNDPAVLFYTSDFLTGVIDMTMEERGQYITLLCYQHQKGHIKEETIRLLVGYTSVNVMKHFKQDKDGLYFNERMEIETEKRHNFTESRRNNGKKGGRPKLNEPNDKAKKNLVVNHKDNLMGNENENENINDIYSYIECNFNRLLSPLEYEEVSTWENNELTRYAIKQSVLNGVYNIKYIQAILNNYEKNSITTVQQAQERDKEFKNKTKKIEWSNEDIKENIATEDEIKEFEKSLGR